MQEFTGVNIERDIVSKASFSGMIRQYYVQKRLFDVYALYQQRDYETCYHKAIEFIKTFIKSIEISDPDSQIDSLISLLSKSKEYFSEYKSWAEYDNKKFIDWLFSAEILLPEERTEENIKGLDRTIVQDSRKALQSKYLRIYLRSKGESPILEDAKLQIRDGILISSDLNLLEASLKPSDVTDSVIMTMLLKIEPIIDYSYFILAFSFRGSVWFVTDFIEFSNPRIATCSRNPRRRSEGREDAIPFPYRLIDDVIEWRKDSTLPTKAGEGLQEIYTKKLREYLSFGSRVHLRILVDAIMQKLVQGEFDFPVLNQFGNLVADNRKMIGEGSFDDESKFEKTNYEPMKAYINQLIIPGQTTLPALTSQALEASPKFAPQTLMTQEDFERNVAWFKHEEIRKTKQQLLDDYYKNHSASDIDLMRQMLFDNRQAIYELVSVANSLYFYRQDAPVNLNFGGSSVQFPQLFADFQPHYWYNYFTVSHVYARENYCVECHRFKTKNQVIRFSISTWEELELLTGKTREELPKTFANFLHYIYIPYYGNLILDNVNPEFLIKDPLSAKFQNGFNFEFHVCGKCLRHYIHKNKKFDEAAVIWSSKEHKIVDIVEHSALVNQIKEQQRQQKA